MYCTPARTTTYYMRQYEYSVAMQELSTILASHKSIPCSLIEKKPLLLQRLSNSRRRSLCILNKCYLLKLSADSFAIALGAKRFSCSWTLRKSTTFNAFLTASPLWKAQEPGKIIESQAEMNRVTWNPKVFHSINSRTHENLYSCRKKTTQKTTTPITWSCRVLQTQRFVR